MQRKLTQGIVAIVVFSAALVHQPLNAGGGGIILDRIDWDLDVPGLGAETNEGEEFGYSMARGDFDRDGFDDLAIGIPRNNFLFGNLQESGTVLVLYGAQTGLRTSGRQYLYQTTEADSDGVEVDDRFGWSLAAGDFDGDGYDDLVVGTPFENVDEGVAGDVVNGGAINIFYGTQDGLATTSQFLNQSTGTNNPGTEFVSQNDRFGWSVATGDFDNDGFEDLAVGVPLEDFGNAPIVNGGQVEVYYGSDTGIDAESRDSFSQNTFNIMDNAEEQDRFGWSLATGRFDDDAYVDLAIGVYGESVNGEDAAGAVHVIYGGPSGLTTNDEIVSQAGEIRGIEEAGDNFGYSIAAGDINADGIDDLVVGAYREDVDDITDGGAIHVIYGANNGLTDEGNQIFTQDTDGVPDVVEPNDSFGEVVHVGDVDYDGFDDVIVGTPDEDLFDQPAGAMHVLLGTEFGLSTNGFLELANEQGAEMGRSIAVGRFGGGQRLALGIPSVESEDGDADSGAARVFEIFTDIIFTDGLE